MTTALLVIDVQQGLCSGDEAAYDIERVIGTINRLSKQARAAGTPVVFVQHEEDEGSLRHGTAPWQLAQGLDARPGDARIRKTKPNSFQGTDLQQLLQERGATRVVVCGLQSDFCVDATVRGALALGYEVTLVEDAHSTVDSGGRSAAQISAERNASLKQMAAGGARVAVVPASAATFSH
jgi:nicotinamidase-related amidase